MLLDDSVRQFARAKPNLRGRDGTPYKVFRTGLAPDYRRVWIQIVAGYTALAVLFVALLLVESASPLLGAAMCIPFALAMGYTIHFLALFQHAATHYGLSSDPQRNDVLSNVVLGILLGGEINAHRAMHMQHHAWHGTTRDPENAYAEPLTWRFFVGWMSGVRTIKKILNKPAIEGSGEPQGGKMSFNAGRLNIIVSLCVHAAIFAIAVYFEHYALAIAWGLAVGIFFPMLSDLRLILEHRSDSADPNIDYRVQPHGQFTRMFRGGFFTHTFGGAGFDYHLLHHWEPSVPFERLSDLDHFLRDAGLSDYLETRTMSYRKAFNDIVRS